MAARGALCAPAPLHRPAGPRLSACPIGQALGQGPASRRPARTEPRERRRATEPTAASAPARTARETGDHRERGTAALSDAPPAVPNLHARRLIAGSVRANTARRALQL